MNIILKKLKTFEEAFKYATKNNTGLQYIGEQKIYVATKTDVTNTLTNEENVVK